MLDTRHIRNVGEFFSPHYVEALLEGDLRDVFARWRAAERAGRGRVPEKALLGLAERYFHALARARVGDAGTVARASAEFHGRVLSALGYPRAPLRVALPDGEELALSVAARRGSHWRLWALEVAFPGSEDAADPLGSSPLDPDGTGPRRSVRELLDGPLLRQEEAPRWILVLAGPDVVLIDRDKWGRGQYVHFELGAMLGERRAAALRGFAGLLHRDVLAPESGRSLLEELDERSHRHAYGVSTALGESVREAVEALGNEALWYRRRVLKEKTYELPELAGQVRRESVRYLYRLLVLLYVEGRGGELGVVPMGEEAYREGLSVESLRELELVPLSTERSRNGYYFDRTLRRLFEVMHGGWPRGRQEDFEGRLEGAVDLVVEAQGSALFEGGSTPLMSGVKLRNCVLQRVIRLLSLSREGSGRRGRISYAQLGINQLGAVYEGLLSYTGFFAQERLYEVRNASRGERVYFVGESRAGEYRDEEFRRDASGERVSYAKGTYLFRLAGRDRERSGSFYTPEVLTRSLTKYTLGERLQGLTADEVLELTVCEPAMGSGAFLGEAVSQLATAYLERKQAEVGERIAAEDYGVEHARARYHFAVHRCYGVDLNPLAAELGKVSLWLGVLQRGVQAPHLDLRIRVGNSLVGARREVYGAELLTRAARPKAGVENWMTTAPTRVAFGEPRPEGSVYHFLVPAAGMAGYESDRVVKGLCPEEMKALRTWRAVMKRPFGAEEVARLQRLSARVDALWAKHAAMRRRVLERVRQPIALWGQPPPAGRWMAAEECERVAAELQRPGSPYTRLRAVMDLWCSLWTWPIERIHELPDRTAWMNAAEAALSGPALPAEPGPFVHWALEFPEVFEDRGGFDVVLGNPPWIKLVWREAGILGDLEPSLDLRKHSAAEVARRRAAVLADPDARARYLAAFCEDTGTQRYLGAASNYPLLQGVQTNLYKCFLGQATWLVARAGTVGLIHQKGLYDDPRGGALRATLSRRLRLRVHFINKLLLFPEVEDQKHYEFTVFGGEERAEIGYTTVSNILHPATLEGSFAHDGDGPVPGIKDADGRWDLEPHRSRLVPVDRDALGLFARLYDPPGTAATRARLPVLHSRELLSVLRRFARAPRTLGSLGDAFHCTEHFHETNQQKDGTIRRETRHPRDAGEWIVSGPHFYVATPFNKTPREGCRHNQDYEVIDLVRMADDALPRTNYVPACDPEVYAARTPRWGDTPTTAYYRHVNRRMVAPTGERSLTPAIIPPGVAHTDLVFSVCFRTNEELVGASGMWSSLPVDFFVKSTGKGDARADVLALLPLPAEPWAACIRDRALRLNCLTRHYAALWDECLPPALLPSARDDPRTAGWEHAPRTWSRAAPLRTPFARRQALVELDALAALSLGMTAAELQLVYRVQFPVLRQYERETYYDRRGAIVFTTNRGLAGVGVTRAQWREIADAASGDALPEWARDAGGPYEPPFDRCDREHDMARAHAYFLDALGE